MRRRKPYNKIEDIKALRRFSYFLCKLGLKSFVVEYQRPIINAAGQFIGWERAVSHGLGLAEAKAFCEKWIDYEET